MSRTSLLVAILLLAAAAAAHAPSLVRDLRRRQPAHARGRRSRNFAGPTRTRGCSSTSPPRTAARRSGRSSTGRSTCCRAKAGRGRRSSPAIACGSKCIPRTTAAPLGQVHRLRVCGRGDGSGSAERLHARHDYARAAAAAGADDRRGRAQLQRHLGERERRHPLRYRATSRDEQQPPLKPEYMARWRQRAADAAAGRSTADPTAACLPAGFPRFLDMVFPGEILQAEHQLNWYAEFGEATVRIYLDGRAPPADLAAELLRLHDRALGRQHARHQDDRPARRHADRYDRAFRTAINSRSRCG